MPMYLFNESLLLLEVMDVSEQSYSQATVDDVGAYTGF